MDNDLEEQIAVEKPTLQDYHREVLRRLLWPVIDLLEDPTTSEIMINGPDEIFVEQKGRLSRADRVFADDADLEAVARGILQYSGKRIMEGEYSYEARLHDGSRVHIVLPPAARPGICIAIRKFPLARLTLDELTKLGALNPEMVDYLAEAVAARMNIIISGGTGTGKTTLVNALSEKFSEEERIILIEDVSELQLDKKLHVVPFEVTPPDRHNKGGITVRELFKASLRMRPDRVVVGECRGGEAMDMIQAMNSGHSGSLSTVHANNPRDAMIRLETLCLMSDIDIPLAALRMQLCSAIDLVVQVVRHGPRRYVQQVARVDADEDHRYTVVTLIEND